MEVGEVISGHPLLKKEIRTISTWAEWMDKWDQSNHAEELCGLLHVAFDVPEAKRDWPICFLLELADGYNSDEEFKECGSHGSITFTQTTFGWMSRSDVRNFVANKAWYVLCDRFFKDTAKSIRLSSRPYLFCDERVFKKLIWFFDDRVRRHLLDANLSQGNPKDHREQVAREFVSEMIRFVWDYSYYKRLDMQSSKQVHEAQAMFLQARPHFVRILSHLGELHFLLRVGSKYIDEPTMEALKEIALRYDRDVDEALISIYDESRRAAEVYIVLRARLVEAERQRQIEELEVLKQESEERLTRIKSVRQA